MSTMKHLFCVMLGILGICASIPAGAQQVITVSNASELISSLGSNRKIVVLPGTYNLTAEMNNLRDDDALPYLEDYWMIEDDRKDESVTLCREYDGLELLLENISNLTITAYDKSDMPLIIIEPRYAFVMRFRGGSNIRLDGLTMGHTEGGYCEGGVVGFDRTDYVSVSGCDLYGCGMEGINAIDVNGLSVDNTTIRDCSYQIMTLQNSKEVLFNNCRFLRNRQFSLVNVSGSKVEFRSSVFCYNEGPLFNVNSSDVSLKFCGISHDISNLGNAPEEAFYCCNIRGEEDAGYIIEKFASNTLSDVDSELAVQYPCIAGILMHHDAGLAWNGRIKVGKNGNSTIERLVNAFCSHYPGNVTDESIYPTKGVKVTMDPKSGYFHSDTDPSGKTSDGLEMCYWKMDNGYNIVAARVNYTYRNQPCVLLMIYRYEPGKDVLVPLTMEGPDSWQMEEMFPATLYDGATVELPRQGKDIRFRAEAGEPVRIARWSNGRFVK